MNREELAAEIESVSVRPDVTLTLSFKGDVWREVVSALREAGRLRRVIQYSVNRLNADKEQLQVAMDLEAALKEGANGN